MAQVRCTCRLWLAGWPNMNSSLCVHRLAFVLSWQINTTCQSVMQDAPVDTLLYAYITCVLPGSKRERCSACIKKRNKTKNRICKVYLWCATSQRASKLDRCTLCYFINTKYKSVKCMSRRSSAFFCKVLPLCSIQAVGWPGRTSE